MGQTHNGQYVNENNLDSLQTPAGQDRNILQMQYSININTVNQYQFMDDTYNGTGGYRDGSYLIPFSRESSYLNRKQLAHFKNYLKPILRAMIEPCFTQEAPRSVKTETGVDITDSLFNEFIEDCDAAGQSLQEFTKMAVSLARRHGVSFVVLDNYPSTAQPKTVSEAISSRVFPYAYCKRAFEVESYETDQFGNLMEIVFTDAPAKIVNENGTVETQKRWRKWTATESIVLTQDKNTKKFLTLDSAFHGLGVVPVIMCFSEAREDKTKVLVDPPLYDIAKLNYVIFNQSAEIRDQERAQAFSIFFCQGVPPTDLVISNNTYINLPDTATISPGYASPDFNIIKGLVENQDQIRKDLFVIAEQNGVVGVESAKSGVAMAFDFWAQESTLKQTSSMATTLEQDIASMFMRYTNETFVYTVSYPTDFAPMGLDNEIQRFERVLKIPGINSKLASEIQKKLARLVLRDEDVLVVNQVIESIENVKEKSDVTTAESDVTATAESDVTATAAYSESSTEVIDVNSVSATALNGAQVESLLSVVAAVTSKQMPVESAKSILAASFPSVNISIIDSIIDPLRKYVPEKVGDDVEQTE
jgi:hypothetical protein